MEYQFLSQDASLHGIAQEHVLRDAASARLSLALRAYYLLRPGIPMRLRRLMQRIGTAHASKDWYLPRQFMQQFIAAVAALNDPTPIIHPWPTGSRFAFVLTHDVETHYGVERIERLAAIEEELGLRSSWNIVPYNYQVDPGLLRDLVSRGFEIGVHGYNHDGRLYWSRHEFGERAKAINIALRKYQAVGFRSPMVHRNLEWLQDLDIEYDASCFDADPHQPMPGGVGTIWPFIAGKFVELPYTMPQDHTLFIALGESDTTIWQTKLNYVADNYGMAMMLTHPDYLDSQRMLDMYRDFLLSVRERGGYWHALPRDASAWWRKRAASSIERSPDGTYDIHGPARELGRVVTLRTDGTRLCMDSVEELSPQHAVPNRDLAALRKV